MGRLVSVGTCTHSQVAPPLFELDSQGFLAGPVSRTRHAPTAIDFACLVVNSTQRSNQGNTSLSIPSVMSSRVSAGRHDPRMVRAGERDPAIAEELPQHLLVRTWVMRAMRMNSLKSLAMNCGPLTGNQILYRDQNASSTGLADLARNVIGRPSRERYSLR